MCTEHCRHGSFFKRHAWTLLCQLPCLPVCYKIAYKLAVMTYKICSTMAPADLTRHIKQHSSAQSLHSPTSIITSNSLLSSNQGQRHTFSVQPWLAHTQLTNKSTSEVRLMALQKFDYYYCYYYYTQCTDVQMTRQFMIQILYKNSEIMKILAGKSNSL